MEAMENGTQQSLRKLKRFFIKNKKLQDLPKLCNLNIDKCSRGIDGGINKPIFCIFGPLLMLTTWMATDKVLA
jgi:hypothetical protein